MTTQSLSVSIVAATNPSWTTGAINQWVTIQSTALLPSMTTNPPIATGGGGSGSVGIYSYSAGALHPTTLDYYAIGGGHSDYAGNEVYKLNLAAQSPTWTLMCPNTQPSSGSMWAAGGITGDGYAYYWDGKPASRHTWQSCAQIITSYGTQGQLLLMGAGSVWGSGNGIFTTIDTWDIATRAYTWINPSPLGNPNGPNPNFATYPAAGYGDATKDSRGDLWVTMTSQGSQQGTVKWTAATKTWSNAVLVSRETSGCAVYDSLRDRIVNFPTTTGATGHYFSAVDGSGLTFFGWSGTPPTNLVNRYRGVAWYEPNIDRFVYVPQATTQIWHIHPTTFTATQQTTTGTAPALDPLVVAGNYGSGYAALGNRFHYIPQYRGCICFTQTGANAAFIRTS
jgi:hypothetical protein